MFEAIIERAVALAGRAASAAHEPNASEHAMMQRRVGAKQGVPAPPPPFDAKSFVDALPARPGVYRMLDAQGEILYVGKARNLKSRVGSYFQPSNVQPKVQALVAKTASMEVTITNSDTEALLLEFNLIKKHRPRFNVVLRDDKSFPVPAFGDRARLSAAELLSRLAQGGRPVLRSVPVRRRGAGDACSSCRSCFGCETATILYFANRSRPCLQYQIQRCTAPCVGLIAKEDYARDVGAAIKVLEGRNDEVQVELARRMEIGRRAAELRGSRARARPAGKHLKAIQAQQIVTADIDHDADVIAIAAGNGEYCVALMFVRGGRSLGSTTFFPKAPLAELPEVLAAFVTQYYLERESPAEIIVERDFDEMHAARGDARASAPATRCASPPRSAAFARAGSR